MNNNLAEFSFVMEIRDIFIIKDVGIIVTGIVDSGMIKANDAVCIADYEGNVIHQNVVNRLESMSVPNIKSASTGNDVGLMFTDKNILDYVGRGLFVVVE